MLSGTRIIVAGAGLAGLIAANELRRRRATVRVLEARDRVGGRVWTRPGEGGALVEAGGEFVDHDHKALRRLVSSCGLRLVRVLREGFGVALALDGGIDVRPSQGADWRALSRALAPFSRAYAKAGASWQSAVAARLAADSLKTTLDRQHASPRLHALTDALRGFYLADAEGLSALVAIDQMRAGAPGSGRMYRIEGGATRLADVMARRLGSGLMLEHVLRRVTERDGEVQCTIETRGGLATAAADYVVVTVPPPLIEAISFDPPLPAAQRAAYGALTAGAATKVSLLFDAPWWRQRGRPRAYGTNLPIGALWDGGEDQRSRTARRQQGSGSRDVAMLTFLAGASASAAMKATLATRGAAGIVEHLTWMGPASRARLAAPAVSWEDDPWARGGYAVFGPGFDPRLRAMLAATHGRVLFAGEHTSEHWQGFMNGAVESGLRAVDTIEQLENVERAGRDAVARRNQ
jgi:monoamine oxidase